MKKSKHSEAKIIGAVKHRVTGSGTRRLFAGTHKAQSTVVTA